MKTNEVKLSKRITAIFVLATYIITSSPALLFAQEIKKEQDVLAQAPIVKEEVLISAKDGGRVVLGDASIEIPKGALKKDTAISITRLSKVSDTGESLYNATAKSGGYRFLPEGTKFLKDVTITLPYSKELNTKEQALNELYTYFYDTTKKQWIKLERLEVDKEKCVVRSLSTHFTDMINATLTLPESASPVDVNLNSIKNLEAAKPDSHLIKFNSPKMSNMADASFSFELSVPSGRRGIEPSVCVNYSSGSGNGIMGKGFDVTYGSSITTDTRFGLPNYDTNDTYMLDGIELQETSRRGTTITYRAQKESSFSRIVRYNAGTSLDYWEVTDKSGTKRIYEQNNSSCTGRGTRTFTWNVTKIEDVHANNVIYEYEKSDGYVYPTAIYYTGFDGQKGNYSVCFHYDENGTKRQDIRIDARSKEIISCKKLLTSITTHYKNQEAIRTYSFSYTEGLAKEKMLTSLAVQNNADESYEYTFDYVKPEKDGNGNDIYFAEAKEWENGKAISESGGKSSGTNVHTSAGAGFGFSAIDARGTGGITGSSSSSSGYAKEVLTDIDGDGKCESIVQTGSVLNIYRQNGTGTGFSQKAQRIDLSKIKENSAAFLMNEESSSTSSFGWNVYGGAGTTHGAASVGYVHSDVNQEGTSKLHTGFYDMDGDGLVDIVTGTNEYLHNDTKEGGAVSFSSRKIINYPETVVKKLDSEALKNYRKSYCLQRPFMAWKSLYDGTVNIRTTHAGSGAVKILAVYGDEKISREDGLAVQIWFCFGSDNEEMFKRCVLYVGEKGFESLQDGNGKKLCIAELVDYSFFLGRMSVCKEWDKPLVLTDCKICDRNDTENSVVHILAKSNGVKVVLADNIDLSIAYCECEKSLWKELSELALIYRVHLECDEKGIIFVESEYGENAVSSAPQYSLFDDVITHLHSFCEYENYANDVLVKYKRKKCEGENEIRRVFSCSETEIEKYGRVTARKSGNFISDSKINGMDFEKLYCDRWLEELSCKKKSLLHNDIYCTCKCQS